jgi:hypothetical protein
MTYSGSPFSSARGRLVLVSKSTTGSGARAHRSAMAEVAAQVGVDPKTVERWIVLGRIPHRSHRWATASLLGTDEAYL